MEDKLRQNATNTRPLDSSSPCSSVSSSSGRSSGCIAANVLILGSSTKGPSSKCGTTLRNRLFRLHKSPPIPSLVVLQADEDLRRAGEPPAVPGSTHHLAKKSGMVRLHANLADAYLPSAGPWS